MWDLVMSRTRLTQNVPCDIGVVCFTNRGGYIKKVLCMYVVFCLLANMCIPALAADEGSALEKYSPVDDFLTTDEQDRGRFSVLRTIYLEISVKI